MSNNLLRYSLPKRPTCVNSHRQSMGNSHGQPTWGQLEIRMESSTANPREFQQWLLSLLLHRSHTSPPGASLAHRTFRAGHTERSWPQPLGRRAPPETQAKLVACPDPLTTPSTRHARALPLGTEPTHANFACRLSEVLFQPQNLASSSAQPWSVLGASLHHEGLLAPDRPQGPAFSLRATRPGPLATPRPEKLAGPTLSRSPPRGLAKGSFRLLLTAVGWPTSGLSRMQDSRLFQLWPTTRHQQWPLPRCGHCAPYQWSLSNCRPC